ncbi:MAG: hypothetical protein PVJ72_12285 [Gammaproteobacteria bacterium]|jgi:hypothetical protein
MRIAGINSPNYHLNQPNKPQKTSGQTPDPSYLPQSTARDAISKDGTQQTRTLQPGDNQPKFSQPKLSQPKLSQQNGVLMQPTARNDARGSRATAASDERVQFYRQQEALQTGAWQAYSSDARSTTSPTPDNTSHKAKAAISEYLQTQYIEERLHFKAVLGIDDYA